MQWEVYVLAAERSLALTRRFLSQHALGFEPAAAEYPFPRFADPPAAVYASPEEVINRLVAEPDQPYELYWTNPDRQGLAASAMLFFTIDKGMIAGIALRSEDETVLRDHLERVAEAVRGRWGTVMFETPPPDSAAEFRDLVRETSAPRLMPEV